MKLSINECLNTIKHYIINNRKQAARIMIIILILLIALVMRGRQARQDTIIKESTSADISEVSVDIYVDISGEVKKPGIYSLDEGTRLYQLIDKAGGLTDKADINLINQAEPVEDGQKIVIPSRSEDESTASTIRDEESGLVNINLASKEQLITLPGIGDAIAQRIIDYRTGNRFKSKQDLMQVSGIGQKTYEKMQDLITI